MKDHGTLAMHFGAVVRTRRTTIHMSQEELAFRSELHRTYISDIERGTRNLALSNAEKVARALDTALSDLIRAAEQHRELAA